MVFKYKPSGVCSREITIDVNEENETVNSVSFVGGCNGNLKGIGALVKGKSIDEIIEALEGIDCNYKGTSCPDQLAKALTQIQEQL
ncbi:MAG: TIGR03905 family TSCPD domain-containing protein [Eubacterium sp.]|nr:TIGR03905 family TSCPD domain-containing protein [Eubacterium sp.]